MRVTFLLPGYAWKPVGGYRVVYEYANCLASRGHLVTVVHARRLPRGAHPPARTVEEMLRRKADFLRNVVMKPRLGWHTIDPRVELRYVPVLGCRHVPDADAVFATWWATAEALLGLPASKGEKCYLIQSYEVWGGPAETVDRTWRAPLAKVVIAKWLFQKGLDLGVPPSDMVHVPNGLDFGRFRLQEPIAARRPRVAMLYSSMATKGFLDGVEALRIARSRFPSLEAVLFGTERRPRGLPDWISFIRNPRQEVLVREIYNGSSIYLCPSWLEGWHLPPAEAMACGCAVVSTDIGGVRDYAIHGETALLSPPRDPAALAVNLVALLDDEPRRAELARSAHRNIQQFTWDRSAELLDAFLRRTVERAHQPPPV